MATPFEGLRVIEITDRVSGAFAARLFGDFGADVVLVEPTGGHALRHEPPFLDDRPGLERSALHAYINWNKRSLVIDNDRDIGDLIASADLVVTTADPISGAWFARALDRLRADAVHLSITPHGLKSPLRGLPGNNLTASARTGWSYINGYRDEPPLQMPRHQTGYVGGVAGFIAAAAALRRPIDSSRPELVDVSEVEALALTVHPWGVAAVYESTGFSYGPAGGRQRGEPGPLWDTADGRMHLGFADFRNWSSAMDLLRLPELGRRKNLIPDINRHSQDLSEVVAGASHTLASLQRWPVFHGLAKLRCVVGVMQDIHDIVRDPQLSARSFLVETAIGDRKVLAAGAPARLSPSPWAVSRTAPRLGEQSATIRNEDRRTSNVRTATGAEHEAPPGSFAGGPLGGVRVLSLAQAWSGTFGTELLALLGADVVQIGSLHRNDVWRRVRNQVPPGLRDPRRVQHALNTQGLYNSVNLNKREVTLDLRQERGRDLFWRLVPRFDVLADNFRPNVLPSWGVSLARLHELRPGMIWASISGYGADGPYSEYPGTGATTEPMAGLSSLHGYEGDVGMNTGGLYPDPVAGYFLAASVIAALNHRDRTGDPQRVDLSMMEAIATVCGHAIVEYDATGRIPRPGGNHHPQLAPHNNYAARDGEWLAIAVETDDAWLELVRHTGDRRLADARFATMAARKANEPVLDAIIAEWCAGQNVFEAEDALGRLGIAAARIVPLYEIYDRPDPNFLASGFISRVDHPEAGPTWLPGRPWRFTQATCEAIRPSPCVGQHSREVLAEELGIGDEEFESLVADRVTGTLDDLERIGSTS